MLTFIKSVVWPFIKSNKYLLMAIISGLLFIRRLYRRYKDRQEKVKKEKKDLLEKSQVKSKPQLKLESPRSMSSFEEISTNKVEGPTYGARKLSEITFKNDPKMRMEELPEENLSLENLSDEKSTNSTLERMELDNIPSVGSKKRFGQHNVVKTVAPDTQVIESQIVPIRTAVKITLSTLFASLMIIFFMMIGLTRKINALESLATIARGVGSI